MGINNNSIRTNRQSNERVGMKKTNSQGLVMKIVEYVDHKNIVVQFEDLSLRKTTYERFKVGNINSPLETRKTETKIGEQNTNSFGDNMLIVAYRGYNDIDILFNSHYVLKNVRYCHFKSGLIRYPYTLTVKSKGYLGEGKYSPENNPKQYALWKSLITRATEDNPKLPTYKNCTISKEWCNFQTFCDWYINNYYEIEGDRINVDKDWIIKGNKHYSAETCVLCPYKINIIISKNKRKKNPDLPLGVKKINKRYIAYYGRYDSKDNKSVTVNLGAFQTPEEAFQAYKTAKEAYIRQMANEYKAKYPQFPEKLYNAMLNYEVEITD